MRWTVLLISSLSVVNCRPQSEQNADPSVEFEKQNVVELQPLSNNNSQPTQRKVEADTKDILDKIAEVNKKQGLTPKRQKPNYFHFPFSYYSRSQDANKNQERQRSDFRFSSNPFANPIFEYLEREKLEQSRYPSQYDSSTNRMAQELSRTPPGYGVSLVDPNAEATEDDQVPGQTVKRKIVHQQTFMIPNPGMEKIPMQMPVQMIPPSMLGFPNENQEDPDKNNLSNLEKQTVNNIRNIVSSSQVQPQSLPIYYNPYAHNPMTNQPMDGSGKTRYGFLTAEKNSLGQVPDNGYNYQLYGPYSLPTVDKARQNWNWPGANYFPIFIRDPFLQMYNAITTMIEYGPNAGNQNPCAGGRPSKKKTTREEGRGGKHLQEEHADCESEMIDDNLLREGKATNFGKGSDSKEELPSLFDIKTVEIGTNKDNTLKFSISMNDRESKVVENPKSSWDKIKVAGKSNPVVINTTRLTSKFSDVARDVRPSTVIKIPQPPKATVLSPPTRDPTHQTQEFGEESEEEKSEEVISNDGNKKLFSRDNTGSGVFINKLKVRTGGVAIAGPGGIATAGSGGTAIVGPNGVAYTQPDSLAIAGSGTKVVAVDPTINLGDLISGNSTGNKTGGAAFPPTRIGRVVAVGPVIYYNKGFITFPNGLRFPKWLPQPVEQAQYFGSVHRMLTVQPALSQLRSNDILMLRPAIPIYQLPNLLISNKSINEKVKQKDEVTSKLPTSSKKEEVKVASKDNKFQKLIIKEPSLAPYRAHPLFHYLKNKNTIQKDRIISFRNTDLNNDITTLILKPVARSVAGVDGNAISTPLSKAILRQGTNVDILFEPEAVAIAGPGGVAHAESDLEISYEDV